MRKNSSTITLILMFSITTITQILTLLKSSVVAGTFGASNEMDAYNLANNIVSFVFGFIAAGISTIIIPEYVNDKERKHVDSFVTILYGGLSVVIFLMILLRNQIIGVFSNRDEMFVNLAANILILMLLSQLLSSVANITVAYFQCKSKYNLPKVVNLICQLIIVVVLIVFRNISIMQYALIIAGGVVLNFVIDFLFALKTGWRYRPVFKLTPETRRMYVKFMPIVFSSGIYRLSLLVDSTIASMLETGKISLLSYSTHISSMVNTIIVGNLLVYFYPKLSRVINDETTKKLFWRQTAAFHSIVCLMVAGFVSVGQETVSLLFCRGAFTTDDAKVVYICASIYIFGQQTSVIRDLIYRYFYAKGETKIPAINSAIVSVINIAVSLVMVKLVGFYGIALGTIIASFVSTALVFIKFSKKFGFTENACKILLRYGLNLAIMVSVVFVVWITKYFVHISSDIVSIIVFGMESVALYSLLNLLFNRKTVYALKSL